MSTRKTEEYRLIDSGNFQKLETFGPYRFIRPSPQAVWRPRLPESDWKCADALFKRYSGGDGEWIRNNNGIPDSWPVTIEGLRFNIRMTDFGHTGLFPEQLANWRLLRRTVRAAIGKKREISVLNLFAYTGGSTLACAAEGAKVAHIDASKATVAWARANAETSGLSDKPIRWITEDALKFVRREIRRGSRYQGIILDPPTYGRGNKREVWKIEDRLGELLDELQRLMAPDFLFMLLTSHSPGHTPTSLRNLLSTSVGKSGGRFDAGEMLIEDKTGTCPLPSGTSCLYTMD